jgi:hypothetical protein
MTFSRMLSVCAVAGFQLSQQDPAGPVLPDSDPAGRWVKAEASRTFTGQQLYDLIDGGAALFEEYGFVSVMAGRYATPGGASLSVEVYRMSDPHAAYGIFSAVTQGRRDRASGSPGIRYTGEYYTCLTRGSHFATVTASDPARWDTSCARGLAGAIEELLPGTAGIPPPVHCLEIAPTHYSEINLIRGKLGLQNAAPPWYLPMAPLGETVLGREGLRMTLATRTSDDSAASSAALRIVTELGLKELAGESLWAGETPGVQGTPLLLAVRSRWLVISSGATVDSCKQAVQEIIGCLHPSNSPDGEASVH